MRQQLLIVIISSSILFQFGAAALALRLIKASGRMLAWILVACALCVMGIRRSVTLAHILNGTQQGDLTVEILGLVIALLMVSGIALIRPLFEELMRSRQELLDHRDELERINRGLEDRIRREVQSNREKDSLMLVREREATMGEMVAGIAHQWKQPLNNLSLILQGMPYEYRGRTPDEAELDRAVAGCLELVQYMSSTTDEFRSFFAPQKLPRVFSVAAEVERTLRLISAAYSSRNIRIERSVEEDSSLNGSANEYAQVLLSLLQNCQEAFAERKVAEPQVAIHIFRDAGRSVVTISDNAGGISDEVRSTMFNLYESTKPNGSGIGLYLARMIVEKKLGGSISSRNIDGGVEFRIEV